MYFSIYIPIDIHVCIYIYMIRVRPATRHPTPKGFPPPPLAGFSVQNDGGFWSKLFRKLKFLFPPCVAVGGWGLGNITPFVWCLYLLGLNFRITLYPRPPGSCGLWSESCGLHEGSYRVHSVCRWLTTYYFPVSAKIFKLPLLLSRRNECARSKNWRQL